MSIEPPSPPRGDNEGSLLALAPAPIFGDDPAQLRKLTLLLYSAVGPVFVGALYVLQDHDDGVWALPAVVVLIAVGGLWTWVRRTPSVHDGIVPTAIVPTVCCGLGAMACNQMGVAFLAVTSAPLVWAAALWQPHVTIIAWVVAASTTFAALLHNHSLFTAVFGTILFATIQGLVAWTVRGKAQALRALHAAATARASRYEALARALPDTIARATAEGVFLDVQAPAAACGDESPTALPRPMSDLIGRSVYEILSRSAAVHMRDAIARAVETGQIQTVEYTALYGDQERAFETRIVRSGDREVIAVRRDITERKHSERELEDAKTRLEQALVGGREGAFSVDLTTGRVTFDHRYEQMLGYPEGALSEDENAHEHIVHPDDEAPARDRMLAHLRGETPEYDAEFRVKNAAGEWVWLHARARITEWDHLGNPTRAHGTSRNIDAERKERLRQLRDARLEGLAERMNEIELVVTLDGQIRVANDRAVEAYGYSREELLRKNIRDLRAKETLQNIDSQLVRVAGEGALRFETEHVRRDGTVFPVHVSSRKFEVEGEVFLHSLIRDLTMERRRHERTLQAQKMESISRLAGVLAHDFNNLLTVITSYTEMVISELTAGDPHREDLREVTQAATRATELTRRLLAISARQVRAPGPLRLDDVVRSMRPAMEGVLGPGVELSCEPPPPVLWTAHLDREQIEQILSNLLTNAKAAMPHGGTVQIAVANVTDPVDADVFGEPPPPGEYILLSVADTGTGIEPTLARRLFEPALTTRDGTRTTGLGLTIVYGIVRQSSGHIALSTKVGRGSTFRIYFPRSRTMDAAVAAVRPTPTVINNRPPSKVLVVDDDAEVRTVTRRLLERGGHKVIEVSSGEEARRVMDTEGSTVAVIITDVVMPGMTGPELVTGLDHDSVSRPPVIFMSAYADSRAAGIPVLPPRSTFISKPFDRASILAKVEWALAQVDQAPHSGRPSTPKTEASSHQRVTPVD